MLNENFNPKISEMAMKAHKEGDSITTEEYLKEMKNRRITFQKIPAIDSETGQGSLETVRYEGFDKEFQGAPFLAVFLVGGEYDIWALDSEHMMPEIGKMYKDLEQTAFIMGTYRLDQ